MNLALVQKLLAENEALKQDRGYVRQVLNWYAPNFFKPDDFEPNVPVRFEVPALERGQKIALHLAKGFPRGTLLAPHRACDYLHLAGFGDVESVGTLEPYASDYVCCPVSSGVYTVVRMEYGADVAEVRVVKDNSSRLILNAKGPTKYTLCGYQPGDVLEITKPEEARTWVVSDDLAPFNMTREHARFVTSYELPARFVREKDIWRQV